MVAWVNAVVERLVDARVNERAVLGQIDEVDPFLRLFAEPVKGGAEHVAAKVLAVAEHPLKGFQAALSLNGVKVAGFAFTAMAVWRILSYYSYIVVGFFFTTANKRRNHKLDFLGIADLEE